MTSRNQAQNPKFFKRQTKAELTTGIFGKPDLLTGVLFAAIFIYKQHINLKVIGFFIPGGKIKTGLCLMIDSENEGL